MPQRDLYVFAHLTTDFVPAGRLRLTETDRAIEASSFAYGTRYLERAHRFEVDPVSLGLSDVAQVRGRELYPAHGLREFGSMRDAAPDAWGRRVIEARYQVPANSLPESTYLLEAGSDRVGALDVRERLDSSAGKGAAKLQSLSYLLEASERIERGDQVPTQLMDLFGSGPSLGGARPKASVRDEAGVLWLAKFPSRSDTFDVAQAEWATLQLANGCGLNVPEAKVLELGGKSVLLIRRFDRTWDDTQAQSADRHEYRLPFVSALTMVGCEESESPTKSYADMAQAVRQYAHPSVIRQDNRELFARMVFNIIVSNDDDHLKNHGFLRDPRLGGWRLSPLYDVVPRPGIAHERFLHLQVGPQGKLATLDNALAGHAAFTIERSDALAVLSRLWHVVVEWRARFEVLQVRSRLIDQLSPAIRELPQIATDDLRQQMDTA